MLAIFDVEGVLFDAEYLPILAETIGKGDHIWEITKKGISGSINWEKGLRMRVEELRGISYTECKKVADLLPLMPGAREACSILKNAGWKLMAVSGGFTIMTDRLKNELDLDYIYSNELLFNDDKLDGVKINVDSDKAKPALQKISEWKEKPENIVVTVDGANDLNLFDICGLGIAYRAQEQVQRLADNIIKEKDLLQIIDIIEDHYGKPLRQNKQ
ncbi:MAG: phosphoserine phosphatase [Cenarchaeum symbiont of Oopsacas minuta]|nr:phosphoserine phosphatase [Cenarchaeum symbiont of Oopsacas minuta]